MARIPNINPEDMNSHQKRIYDKVVAKTGTLKGPGRGFIHSPVLWETTNTVSAHFENCTLTRQQFRIVGLLTTQYWDAEYTFASQAAQSIKGGEDRAIVEAIRDRQRPNFADPKDEVIYDLVREQLEKKKVTESTFQKAVKLLGYEALVDTLGLIGHFSKISVMVNALEIEVPENSEITLV